MNNLAKIYEKLRIYGPRRFFINAYYEMKWIIVNKHILGSYSQLREDLFIDKILNRKQNGFYIDVGANHPYRFNNTMRFYKRGWHGINIEPNFRNFQQFLTTRPKDINLNLGIAEQQGELLFYVFFPDTLSTFSREEAEKYKSDGYNVIEEKVIPVDTLNNIYEKYCKDTVVDFISIDTEGFDMSVLKSLDWKKFRPRIVCIESTKHSLSHQKIEHSQEHEYLIANNYERVYDNGINSIYVSGNQ